MTDRWAPASLVFSAHAITRMYARAISADDVWHVVKRGEILADYADDQPHPSRLLMAFVGTRPLHVVVAYDARDGAGYVVTVYEPDKDRWEDDFKRRRET
ncbi:MAG: DUF4258 domain-containing protein [Planctomycetes bacterium]|nr:DUF4258 domain-containing protein [Planctomycetota bacterium]